MWHFISFPFHPSCFPWYSSNEEYSGHSVTSVIRTYQRRLNSKPYVCSTTFSCMTLDANGVANKLFLTFLFNDPDVSVLFLKDVGQIRSDMVCCKCGSQLSWCGDTNRKDGYQWRCQRITQLPHALLPRQSGTVHGFSREFNEGFFSSRTMSFAHMNTFESTWWHMKAFLNPYNRMRHYIWPTTYMRRCAEPTWTSSPSSFLAYNVVRSYEYDREHVKAFLNPYNRIRGYIYHLACMFAAVCRSDNVDQFTKFIGIVATTDYLLRPWTGAPLLPTIAVVSLDISPLPHAPLLTRQ